MEILSKFIVRTSAIQDSKILTSEYLTICCWQQHSMYVRTHRMISKVYFTNGKIRFAEFYTDDDALDGSLQGSYEMINDNHVIHKMYHDDELIVEHKCDIDYIRNNVARYKCYVRGIERSYYPSGRVRTKCNYHHGKLRGQFCIYHQDGAIKYRGHYNRDGYEYKPKNKELITHKCTLCYFICNNKCSNPYNRECVLLQCPAVHPLIKNVSIASGPVVIKYIRTQLNFF